MYKIKCIHQQIHFDNESLFLDILNNMNDFNLTQINLKFLTSFNSQQTESLYKTSFFYFVIRKKIKN